MSNDITTQHLGSKSDTQRVHFSIVCLKLLFHWKMKTIQKASSVDSK